MKQGLVMLAAAGLVPLLAACGTTTPSPQVVVTDTPAAVTASPSDTPVAAVATPTAERPATATSASATEEATQAVPEPAAAFPTPNPKPECVAAPIPEDSNIPPVTADEWSEGADDAPITLVEYSDFQ